MIDFDNAKYLKLRRVDNDEYGKYIEPLLTPDEIVISVYKGIRDGVVFTNKRIISVNVQGVTGKSKDFTSMPYNKIQVYSVETSGIFDLDTELVVWFSSVGMVKFEFTAGSNVAEICRNISICLLD